MRTDELDYELPPRLIACRPAEPRDSARLMVLSRSEPDRMEHRTVAELPALLEPGDLLVRNRTWVHPARLSARRTDTGGRVEGLYLDQCDPPDRWLAMLKSNGRLRAGTSIEFLDAHGAETGVTATLEAKLDDHWRLAIDASTIDPKNAAAALERVGATPLPPYIARRRHSEGIDIPDEADRAWYRTIDALPAMNARGSVAAPTAGLHFTEQLLERIDSMGVRRADVLLHVGMGTFKPIETATVGEHPMHTERYAVSADAVAKLRQAHAQDRRIIAVGTTSARTLESLPLDLSAIKEGVESETSILIEPGHAWRHAGALLTNFHLPRSTLLAMVAALLPEGIDRLRSHYGEAIARGYRFYSYGDAMLILP
ncbi:MAG: tRNA preQ1(34) S-adenosylmethionine ribosyltransferase-isomerase QueA [Phycisphaeraceae bacterium]|nr:tRNA preQ1(34) S-adenosylmethionine ribosyltransferase-isomerase QueA [Phycisphaeraceae bacterium]